MLQKGQCGHDTVTFFCRQYEEIHLSNPSVTVSYKRLVDFKHHFDNFLDLGVGGLSKQINELYQRAFASRSE